MADHLILKHLEMKSADALVQFSATVSSLIQGEHGLYALYLRKRLYYVGLASDLRGRLDQHLRDKHAGKWDQFSVYVVSAAQNMRELEALILRTARPEGNSQKGRLPGSLDLTPHLDRGIIQVQEATRLRVHDSDAPAAGSLKMTLRGKVKGKFVTATLMPDRTVRFRSKIYPSPTAAADVALGRHVSGNEFWQVEVRPGEWVRLGLVE